MEKSPMLLRDYGLTTSLHTIEKPHNIFKFYQKKTQTSEITLIPY